MERTELLVGSLSHKTSETGLRRYLEGYGRPIDVTIIRDPVTKKSRGYGFVSFDEQQEVHQVLESQHELDGNSLQVEACLPLVAMDRSDNVSAKKIYVGSLDARVEILHLRRYFVQFGAISDILISRFSKLRRRRYAFVTFESTDAVRRALKPREHSLGEHMLPVVVNRAYPEAQKVTKVVLKHSLRKSGINQPSSSGTSAGKVETTHGGQRNSTERFWDESYMYDIHRPNSPSTRQRPYARKLTRFFEDGQVGDDSVVAAVNPLPHQLEMTATGSCKESRSSERERTSTMVTTGGGEDKNSLPIFGGEDKTGERSSIASFGQAFNSHATTPDPTPGDLDQKLKELEIAVQISKISVQSSRRGDNNNKDGDGRDAQRDQDTTRGKRPDQSNYKSFESLGEVPLQEESCKLKQDQVDASGSLQEPSKGKETRKKSRDPHNFRGIAAKTRVVRIRDSDSESQNGTDQKEKKKYGSFYDSFGDTNVGSKGGITKLELTDDSAMSTSSGSS